jgi:hypothetical protein
VVVGIPGELKPLLELKVGEGSRPNSVRAFLFGYRAGGLYVDAENAGSRGPDWKKFCCVGGVSGGDVIVPLRTYSTSVSRRSTRWKNRIIPSSVEAAKASGGLVPGREVTEVQCGAVSLGVLLHSRILDQRNHYCDHFDHL